MCTALGKYSSAVVATGAFHDVVFVLGGVNHEVRDVAIGHTCSSSPR
jgi:hypothetical protein